MESRLVGSRVVHLGCGVVQLLNPFEPRTAALSLTLAWCSVRESSGVVLTNASPSSPTRHSLTEQSRLRSHTVIAPHPPEDTADTQPSITSGLSRSGHTRVGYAQARPESRHGGRGLAGAGGGGGHPVFDARNLAHAP